MNLLLTVLFLSMAQAHDKVLVTIYAPGGYLRGGGGRAATIGVGVHDAASQGFVFDGNQKLVLMTPGRFVTFEMTPGSHHLGTSIPKNDTPNAPSFDLKAGDHYFVRLTATTKGAWIIQAVRPSLEIVSCETARNEADQTKAVDAKRIDKDARTHAVDGTYFPRCPAQQDEK